MLDRLPNWWQTKQMKQEEPVDRAQPRPANVPGPFYVEDGCCMFCGVWEDSAPDLLGWHSGGDAVQHCFVNRQPKTDAEFERMMLAMETAELNCIRVHACKPEWLTRLRQAGLGDQIDPETGPIKK